MGVCTVGEVKQGVVRKPVDFIPMTQGLAVLADESDIERDETGFTHPNLHRRILTDRDTVEGEIEPRKYDISVWGVDSYRTTYKVIHDEESTTLETP